MRTTMNAHRGALATLALLVSLTIMGVGVPTAGAPAPSGGCPTHGQVACVDRSDGGRTVHVRVGHILKVALGGTTLRWSGLHQVGPALLRRSGGVVDHDGAIMATYTAVKAGRTALRAGGAPRCVPGRPCPQFLLLWQVRVVVG